MGASSRIGTESGVLQIDPLRLVEAVVAGVAFIGAGTIFNQRRGQGVKGITTAASLLMVAVVGIAAGSHYHLLALAVDQPKERTLTTHIPCADFFEIRDKALIAHATQIDPDGGWFRVPMEIQKAVWPTEEYELAKSLVDTSLPEDDLFAGIRDNA